VIKFSKRLVGIFNNIDVGNKTCGLFVRLGFFSLPELMMSANCFSNFSEQAVQESTAAWCSKPKPFEFNLNLNLFLGAHI